MSKILLYLAHPSRPKSSINNALIKAIQDIEGITIIDLYAEYPDFMIDIDLEQSRCESHDIIIFQHPLYWYSVPSILREWQDIVLEHSWAYGSKGRALEGKRMLQVITAGGDEDIYSKEGFNEHTIQEILVPFKLTAKLCKMKWLEPFPVLGIHRGLPEDDIIHYQKKYRELILKLRG